MANPKPGSVVHVELHSSAPEKTKAFYERVFGWKFEAVPQMDYTTFAAPSPPHGGLMSPMEGMGPTVLNYLLSTDIEASQRAIQAAGGSVVVPKSEIPGVGWFAIFRDPGGLTQALYENIKKPSPRAAPARTARRASSRGRGAKKGRGRRR